MSNSELFQKVKELGLPIGGYALFGSAPMGIRGIRECRDIDIIVTDELWNEYQKKDGWIEEIAEHGGHSLSRDCIELWKDWYPGEWKINELIQTAEIVDDMPFVTLDNVVTWKKMKGRDKDMNDIRLIGEFLKL